MVINTVRSVVLPHNSASFLRIHKFTRRPRRATIRPMSFFGKLFGSNKSPESKVLFRQLYDNNYQDLNSIYGCVGRKRRHTGLGKKRQAWNSVGTTRGSRWTGNCHICRGTFAICHAFAELYLIIIKSMTCRVVSGVSNWLSRESLG